MTSDYVLREVNRNLNERMPMVATDQWRQLAPLLERVRDVTSFEWPVVFSATKDRPVLFTASAFADVLLTLDVMDFAPIMRAGFYGLAVLTPGDFLRRERAAGRLR